MFLNTERISSVNKYGLLLVVKDRRGRRPAINKTGKRRADLAARPTPGGQPPPARIN
jgi:hypothetical protein